MSVTTPAGEPTPLAPDTAVSRPAGSAEGRTPSGEPRKIGGGLLDPKILWQSLPGAFKKLDPRVQLRNPVMFVVEVGATITTYTAITGPPSDRVFNWTIVVWLWLTVLFANLAEAVAEGRGKAQAETLRRAKRETVARRLIDWKPGQTGTREEQVPGSRWATTWWSRPVRPSPATATSSRALRRWTSRRSPASPRP
jgi:potassium-transporting ATPase ATP-binding subunit